jgi:hypothetical protein
MTTKDDLVFGPHGWQKRPAIPPYNKPRRAQKTVDPRACGYKPRGHGGQLKGYCK